MVFPYFRHLTCTWYCRTSGVTVNLVSPEYVPWLEDSTDSIDPFAELDTVRIVNKISAIHKRLYEAAQFVIKCFMLSTASAEYGTCRAKVHELTVCIIFTKGSLKLTGVGIMSLLKYHQSPQYD